jgi:proton-coupled amino acid transporter
MQDKTNYFQSIVHILKGNLGTGILAMPVAFKHLGYANSIILLPLICIISAYCVHILVRSSRRASKRLNDYEITYSVLARRSFELGPTWLNGFSELIGLIVEGALLVTQIGVCCVYIIFVVDNVTSVS